MAHEIWDNRVFTGRGKPAWHRLGVTIDGVATWQEAMLLAGLNWQVEKKALRDEWGNELKDGFGKDANIYGIFRDMDNAILGVVGERYSIIQNKEAFAWVDALIGQEGAHYDSAGALKGGQTIFCSAHLPSAGFEVVPGDKHQTYLMFTTSHDGSQSAQVKLTDVRVVCNNTLTAAINDTGASLFIRHTKSAAERLAVAKSLIDISAITAEGIRDKMRSLAEKKVTRNAAESIFDKLFPVSEKAANTTIRSNNINDILNLYEFNDNNQFPEIRGTAYNLVNAITEWTDTTRQTRNTGGNYTPDKARITSAIFGSGEMLKQKAMEIVYREASSMPSMGAVYHSIPGGLN
jgi:phage/plasmid-like protein (TIGR03299 family)